MTPEQMADLVARVVEGVRRALMGEPAQTPREEAMRAAIQAKEQQRFNDILRGIVAKQNARGAEQTKVRHWVLSEMVCTACEARSWAASEVGPVEGPKQCPRCLRMSCVHVLTQYETLGIPLGGRNRCEVRLPLHDCNHALHALRSMSYLAADLKDRGQL